MTEKRLESLTLEQSDKDDITTIFLRNDLLFWVRKFNHPIISGTKAIAYDWKNGQRDIATDIIAPILCCGNFSLNFSKKKFTMIH